MCIRDRPRITLVAALLFIVVLVTVAKVESPLRNVDELAVPDPNLAVGTVPDAKSDASKFVKFAPLIAGKAPVKLLAARDPLNVVAVHTPVANISPSELAVTPVPTLKVATVVIPAMSTPVGDSVTVPTPDRLLILSTLISDAIWVHFPPIVLVIYGNEWSMNELYMTPDL